MKKIFEAAGGYILNNNATFNRIPIDLNLGLDIQRRSNLNKSLKSYHDLDTWQKELYFRVINRQDTLVNVNPAGGKTKPVVMAWEDSFTDLNHDKILWITPTVQLANQVFHVDLKESLLKRLSNWSIGPNNTFPTDLLPPNIQYILHNAYRQGFMITNSKQILLSSQDVTDINEWLLGTAMVLRAGSSAGAIGNLSADTIASVCTYQYAVDIIDKQHPKIIVIDELQEFIPIEKQDDSTSQASAFINILRHIPKDGVLILLTGSMNKDTTLQVIDFINKYFGRKLEPFSVGVDLAKNRASIVIQPHTKMKSQEDRLSIIKNAIQNKDTGNCMIMFNTKSIDPQFLYQNAIYPIAKKLTMILSERSIEQVCGTSPEDNYNKKSYSFKANNRDLLNQVPNYIDLPSATNLIKHKSEDPKYMASYLKYMLSQDVKFGQKYGEGRETLPDPFLAKCLLCGFGYLANGAMKGFRMHNDDIMLVQNLFKQGKIYFLLATDMIGVGTTLTIRKLYLPDLNKFKGTSLPYGRINSSSLVQLINRVGRQTSVAASIYCDPADFEIVNKLLREDPSNTVDRAIFGNNSSTIEQATSLIDKVKMLFYLIRK